MTPLGPFYSDICDKTLVKGINLEEHQMNAIH
jgi:hypothetical protein